MDKQVISDDARLKAEVADKARGWVTDNSGRVESCGKTPANVQVDLRRQGRLFRRLQKAALRKMCVGVFGPSQAGKSYLLSSLAMDDDKMVWGKFAGDRHNFLDDLNPGGGKESTGLVTRFTMTEPENIPAGYPVHVRLLSEAELVKIFANSYFCDCEHKEQVDKEKIQQTLQELMARAGSGNAPHVNLDVMEDLREYVTNSFINQTRASVLEDVYWNEAIELAPKLSLADRTRLFGIIWDNIPEFDAMFQSLAGDLEKLGHAEEAFCGMDALLPREASILDVDSLNRDDFSEFNAPNTVGMMTRDGKSASIPRKNATAIVAELTLVMTHKPADYFDHTDLLDFPGYKARLECSDIRDFLAKGKDGSGVEQFFRRGKVAYLFQRYTAERELTSLLLCVATPDNTPSLPAAIEDWIANTHGLTAQDRANAKTALFYVLTKSDRHFEDKAGAKMETRWDDVVKGTFTGHFAGPHSQKTRWVEEWQPGRPFNNLFMLRNVNVKWDGMMDYDGKTEVGLTAEKQKYKDDLRSAFLNSGTVRRHFRDPQVSFDEIFALNDGGISHIKNALQPLCDPDLKLGQIAQALGEASQALEATLKPFYHSGDQEEELKKKTKFVGKVAKILKTPQAAERFSELLSNFRHPAAQLAGLHRDAERTYEEYKQQAAEAMRQQLEELSKNDIEEDNDDPLGLLTPEESEATPEVQEEAETKDEHYFYASRIIEAWGARMRALAEKKEFQSYYAFPKRDFLAMLDEFEQGLERLGARKLLEKKFRQIAQAVGGSEEGKIRKQAAYANGVLSDFASWLGKNPTSATTAERTINYGDKPMVVFSPPPVFDDYPQLPEDAVDFSKKWRDDWLLAFYGLSMDNVTYSGGSQIDVEQNRRLGELLRQINK